MGIPKWLHDNPFEGITLGNQIHVVYDAGQGQAISLLGYELEIKDNSSAIADKYLTIVPTGEGPFGNEQPFTHPEGRAAIFSVNHDRVITAMQYVAEPREEDEDGEG